MSLTHCFVFMVYSIGGTKVDAYIYSPLLPSSTAGSKYSGLFHVSDWFPTLLGFAGITYTAVPGYELDGVDQSSALKYSTSQTVAYPRSSLLYNIYYNISGKSYDLNTSGPVAIRDNRYKLIHVYTNNSQSETYSPYDTVEDDDILTDSQSCSPETAMLGTYTKMLFDLVDDPYETNDLYDDPAYADVKVCHLYACLCNVDSNGGDRLHFIRCWMTFK